jgi:integrase
LKRAARVNQGSVVFNRRFGTWNFLWCERGQRRSKVIGTAKEFPTKASAWQAAAPLRRQLEQTVERISASDEPALTVRSLVEHYRVERMPRRAMTRQGYNTWLNQYIIPKWGGCALQQLQARPVDLWLRSLELAPKSKVHIRGLLRLLWEFAMWRGDTPMQRNPMELVTVKGATKRVRKPRSLTVEEFPLLLRQLAEPFRTMAVICLCFGLRISECLALKWSDVDWLNGTLNVERGIVHQVIDDVKTPESERLMHIDTEVLGVLKMWKQQSQFSAPDDWMFASPVQIGRLPFSYAGVWRALRRAAAEAGIPHISSHSFRHTFRSWLDEVGTPLGVQRRLMRHTDIRTTMRYGTSAEGDMRQAQEKIVRMALIPAN